MTPSLLLLLLSLLLLPPSIIASSSSPPHSLPLSSSHSTALEEDHSQDDPTKRPLMGYSTWYDVGFNVSESHVLEVAAVMKKNGMLSAGYRFLNLDDGWSRERRDGNERIQPDPTKFPRGMRWLASELHARGFKFGLYTDRGDKTCSGRNPGSKDHEELDAATFVEDWAIDYLKQDSCFVNPFDRDLALRQYSAMSEALTRTTSQPGGGGGVRRRAVWFALCGWHPFYSASAFAAIADSWRISFDNVNWSAVRSAIRVMEWLAVRRERLGEQARARNNNSTWNPPSRGWDDPDFLLDSKRLTPVQSRTQFSLWCVMSAPLVVSAPLLEASEYDLKTWTNSLAISINQDTARNRLGRLAYSSCPGINPAELEAVLAPLVPAVPRCLHVWYKWLSRDIKEKDDRVALVFVNLDDRRRWKVKCDSHCFRRILRGAFVGSSEDDAIALDSIRIGELSYVYSREKEVQVVGLHELETKSPLEPNESVFLVASVVGRQSTVVQTD